jgi:hypothetical protein
MNKKELIQYLSTGLLFGVVIYLGMTVAVHFIESESESEMLINPDFESLQIDYQPIPIPIEPEGVDLTMVTFKFQIRIQNSYTDEMLEEVETIDEAMDYLMEYGKFHDDLFVYNMETDELVLDSQTVNDTMRELKTKEQLLIEVSQHPETFSEAEIFDLLVD